MRRQFGVLPLSPVPQPDETLPGFALRLAALFRRSKVNDLGVAIAMPGCAFRVDDIRVLAARCGESLDSLLRLSYLPTLAGYRYQFQSIEVPRGLLRLWPGRRFCPTCLTESPHHRALWDLGIVSHCPIHKVALDDHCPACGRRLSWQCGPITHCSCGADLRKTNPRPYGEDDPWVANLLSLIAGTVPDSLGHIAAGASDTLHLVVTLGLLFEPDWSGPRRIRDIPHHDPAVIDKVTMAGLDAARRWPDSLAELVDRHRSQAPERRGHYGIAKELGEPFASWIRELPNLDFAAKIREAIYRHFDDDPVIQLELRRSGALRGPGGFPPGRFVTHRQSADLLGCSYETLHRLRDAGAIPAGTSRGKGVPVAIGRNLVQARHAARARGITLKEAAARLGTTRVKMRELLRAGLIREVLRDPGQCLARAIDPTSMNELVTSIECDIEKVRPKEKLLSISQAAKLLKPAGLAYSDFIRAARDGAIRAAAIDCRSRGLRALRFRRTEVLRLAHEVRDSANVIPVNSVARTLGLKWEVVDHLIDRAILPSVGSGPRRSRLISRTCVDEFARRHRTGAELAQWMHTSPRHAAELLAVRGVEPIVGPARDGCRQNIYAVGDLSRAFPNDFHSPDRGP